MDIQDAYAQLGLLPSASDAQVKATWRRLVAAWHPDRNPAPEAGRRMQQINKAYQHIRQSRDGAGGASGANSSQPEPAASPARTAAKASAARAAARAAAEAAAKAAAKAAAEANRASEAKASAETVRATHIRSVHLSLEQAILGCTRTLRGHFTHACDACAGKGQRVLAKTCTTCNGRGAVRKPSLFGWLWNEEACADCGGDGRMRKRCVTCEGAGEHRLSYRRRVRFPAGVRSGYVLSVPAARHGAVEIVLELVVELEPHPFFVLGPDGTLRCEMPVNGFAWMSSRWVEIPTPDGLQQMRLNRDALVYRLGGQGFPIKPKGPRGDYFVKLVPQFPAREDAVQEALLTKLIDATNRAALADPEQPLGQWQHKLQRWSATHKEPVQDE